MRHHTTHDGAAARPHEQSIRDELRDALATLRGEAFHYRNTHRGVQFLNAAIAQAENALMREHYDAIEQARIREPQS